MSVCGAGGRERRVRDHRDGRGVGRGGQQPRRADGAEPDGQGRRRLCLLLLVVLVVGLVSAGGLARRRQVRPQSVGEALPHDRRHHLHCHQAGPVEGAVMVVRVG